MHDLIGTQLGDFEIIRELGRGGMGVVYEARQVSLNRRVAVKALGPGLGLTPRAVERFRREAEAAARLHHTNIVPVYATGEHHGVHFYAMELIDGPSLDHVIRRLRGAGASESTPTADATGPYFAQGTDSRELAVTPRSADSSSARFDRAAAMIADVADALEHAHANGVTHRDIKPSNLLLATDGRLSVTDFGLARLLEQPGMTVTGEFVGTPAYMSPEQVTAGRIPLDHRTDIYSLGATLYELLTLQPPFRAEGRDRLLAMVVQKEPPPPRGVDAKIPRDLETICLKCLEKDPDRRYQTAKQLAEDLRRYLNRFAILAKRAGPLTRARKWIKRNPAISAAGLVVLLALATAGFFAWQSHESEQRRQADEQRLEREALAEKRRVATEKAVLTAMVGQFAESDEALLEAERLGADLAERRFVAGIISHYRGNSEDARRHLLVACAERPNWLAPRAFLAVVSNYVNDWEGQLEHGNTAFRLTPVTAEDYLFRGYAIGLNSPSRGLPDIEEAWKRRRSALAQFVRAEVLMNLAFMSGRVEDAVTARDAMRQARTFMGDMPMLACTSLFTQCAGCVNCRIHGQPDEAKRWLAEGEADFRAAGAGVCRTLPNSLRARSGYLFLRDGSTAALDAENREAGRKGIETSSCQMYLASLFRRGQTDEALQYLDGLPKDGSFLHSLSRAAFLLGRDTAAARAECRRALAEDERDRERGVLGTALSLVGMPAEARAQARVLQESSRGVFTWSELWPFLKRVTAHAYEGTPMDVEAEAGGIVVKRWMAYETLGYAELGRGHADRARHWLRQAAQLDPLYNEAGMLGAVRERILTDPNWPPWLSQKK